jgi:hypothetical protein
MPMPLFRPSNVIAATKSGSSNGRGVWMPAAADPERHYQILAALMAYVYRTPVGYVLTDLGTRENAK